MEYGAYPLIIVSVLFCFVMLAVFTFRRGVLKRQKQLESDKEEPSENNQT